MNYKEKIEAQVAVYFQTVPAARKFDSPENRKLVADRVASWGFAPCEVGVMRALDELIAEGHVYRVDGGFDEKDQQAAADAERRRLEQIAAAPSTREECEQFMGMSEAEVESKYWADPIFQARYRKASETWRLRLPGKPAEGTQTNITEENDSSRWKGLTAKEWHSIPARKASQLLLSDPGFKRAVNRLVAAGKI